MARTGSGGEREGSIGGGVGSTVARVCSIVGSVCVLLVPGCSDADPVGVRDVETTVHELEVGGSARSYRLYVPDGIPAGVSSPLLVVFHGAAQGAVGVELMSWLYPHAEEHALVVAFPEASGDYWNTPNSPSSRAVPDVEFVDALVEDVAARTGLDRSRLYVAGFSNGAIFAQVYACVRGARVAALGVVGAGISAGVAANCPTERPVATTLFFGDQDPQFYWDDGLAHAVGMLGGQGSGDWLADTNGCLPTPDVTAVGQDVPDDPTRVERWRYLECADGASVDFYRIREGGHTWPGSPLNLGPGFGPKTRRLDASETMVDFFLAHVAPSVP